MNNNLGNKGMNNMDYKGCMTKATNYPTKDHKLSGMTINKYSDNNHHNNNIFYYSKNIHHRHNNMHHCYHFHYNIRHLHNILKNLHNPRSYLNR